MYNQYSLPNSTVSSMLPLDVFSKTKEIRCIHKRVNKLFKWSIIK